jgi:hypothetical protein
MFQRVERNRDCRQHYIQIMETQVLAAFMAAEFNKLLPPNAKKIAFLDVGVVQARISASELLQIFLASL